MRRTLALIVTVSALALGCSSASDDADNICRLAGEVAADTSLDPDQRATRLASEVDALSLTTGTRNAWEAVAHAAPDMRYEMFQQGFVEQGVEGWECPALRDHWAPHLDEGDE